MLLFETKQLPISRDTKAKVINFKGSRMTAPAIGSQAATFFVVPTTASQNAVRTINRFVVNIRTPFPNIAKHVVQSLGVGRFCAYVVCCFFGIVFVPSYSIQFSVSNVSCSCFTSVFPFGFGWKAVSVCFRMEGDFFSGE